MARLTGNVYVDPSYTTEITGSTHPITGEVLEFNVNAFAEGGTTSNVPVEGGTIFFNNLDRLGSSIYNDGTYDMVLINTRSNYLYVVPKTADKTYTRNMTVYVDGGTHQHLALLGRSNNVKLMGDLTFTAKNANFGTENDMIGGGDSNFGSGCLIVGNLTFDITNCTTGGSFYIHCGSFGTAEEDGYKVTGRVVNFTSTSAFRGIRTGNNESVYGDFDISITNSSFTNDVELGYVESSSSKWYGTFTLTLAGATGANIYGFGNVEFAARPTGNNTFILNVAAAEKATVTAGVVDNFDAINVAAGATLSAASVNHAFDLNIEVGGVVNTPALNNIFAINVIGDLVQADTVIITGLTTSSVGTTIYYKDQEVKAGKFGGMYTLTSSGDVILHNPNNVTLLVNSNYTDGQETSIGPKGYSTLAAAQAAVVDPAHTTIMFTTMDTSVSANTFSEAVITKNFATTLDGEGGSALDLNGQDVIVGDPDTDVASAKLSVSNTNNINSVAFSGVNGTAEVSISGSGRTTAIGSLDMTGAVIADAQVTVSDSAITNVKLADQANTSGKLTVKNSTLGTVYGGAGNVEADLTGNNTITNVYAQGQGSKIKLAGSSVGTYTAGFATAGASVDTLVYNDGVTAGTIILGGNANVIGSIDATVTGGGADLLKVGGEGDTITGDVEVTITGGKFANVAVSNAATHAVTVNLAGGTVAPMNNGVVINGSGDTANSFPGLVYGASVSQAIDGGTNSTNRTLNVLGNAKVSSITNFDELNVTGGTLNISGGDGHDTVTTTSNTITINGDILNQRAISAGVINAVNVTNTGLIGTQLRRNSDYYNLVGINLSGDLDNSGYIKTTAMTVGGDFVNTGKVTATGSITISGDDVSNEGDLFIRSAFSRAGVFSQDGGLVLNNADFVNSGFVSVGKLQGVKNLTTSKMYVTGGAEITGSITIDADAEVAFTNKANSAVEGLTLGGSIQMYDTSKLVVSGNLTTSGAKVLTVNVGDLIGSNEIVHAEGGVNDWTIALAGDNAGLYSYVKTDTSVVVYSLDQLFVNSAFSADSKCVVDGNTLVFGVNAFATVEDAVAAARTGAKIVIAGDKTGMEVIALNHEVVLDDAIVGDVAAKYVTVTSDSTVNSIANATSLMIDAGAVLSVTETIPTDLHIVIDAEEGSGSRLVLDVDPTKVALSTDNVVILGPEGKAYTAMVLSADPEAQAPAHVGDLFLISSDNVYFRKGNAAFVDGDTFDAQTGDALFLGVNVFETREAAEAAALANDGVLYLVGFATTDGQKGSSDVTTAFEFSGGSSGIYGTAGNGYDSNEDHTTILVGTNVTTSVYGLNKYVNTTGDYTLLVNNSTTGAFYITGNTHSNNVNGDVTAEITNSRLGNVYIGYGNFGTNPDAPIDIDVTIKDSSIGAFFGIETQTGNMDPTNRQDINANININIYDTVVGGTFTVLNTNNEHWNGNGATLLQTYFTVGSINVEIGGATITDNIRSGISLELAGKAPQAFNVPNTLHIVATENSTTTYASYLCEWDTIIIDATANLQLNTLQYSTTAIGDQGDNILDNKGTLTQVMINMSGYKSGTHQVVNASGQIYSDAALSNITVIGDNDLTGQCQLAYTYNADETQLKGIYVFDKTDDMYINTGYSSAVSGTTVGGQELLYGYNAHRDFTKALTYTSEWGGTIVVTGGAYDSQNFDGNNVVIQKGVTFGEITMGDRKASTLTVEAGANIASAIGSGASTLVAASDATLGDVAGFAAFELTADAALQAGNVNLTGTVITIDVDDFSGSSHIILTADGLSGFDAANVVFVGENYDQYSLVQVDNNLVLRSFVPADTYVNPDYTAAITGTILPDGTYLDYGVNAFSTFAEGLDNLGGASNTLTVTGGEFSEDFDLTVGNLAFVGDVVVDGYIVGNGSNTISVDGNVTVDSIEGVKRLVITTDSLLTTGSVDLGGGTIYVTGSAAASASGNLTKVISTEAGVSGATLTGDPGFYVYKQGNDVYILDLTRIYVDPNFTDAVTGTTAYTGDTLIFGVNAFRVASNTNLADATDVNNALVTGGTLFISNWGTAGTQAGDVRPLKDVSIVAQGPTNFSIVFGNNGGNGHVVNDDIYIVMDNTSTPQGGTALIHSGDDNNRWVFNGNVYVTIKGTGNVNTNTGFAISKRAIFRGDLFQVNIEGNGTAGKNMDADITFFRQAQEADFNDVGTVEINITNLYSPNDKWIRLFSNNDNVDSDPTISAKNVVLNLTNDWFRSDNNQNWSISLVNSGANSRKTNYTVNISGTTVDGILSGIRNRAQAAPGTTSQYSGTRTLYVEAGENRLTRAHEFHHIVINADATLTLTDRQGSYGNNVAGAIQFLASRTAADPNGGFDDKSGFVVNMKGYTGSDKMLISAPSIYYGTEAATFNTIDLVVNDLDDTKYEVGLGLTKGVFIITKNGDVLYNSAISTADNGTAFGSTYILAGSNAFGDYETAKAAMDARAAAGANASLFVSGNGGNAFYADGYDATIIGGTYTAVYGTDDANASVASVNLTITGGQFFDVAVSDGTGSVTGDATIEINGGVYGTAAAGETPAVLASIDGSKSKVGGTSTLLISKDLNTDATKADIIGSVANFDSVEIAAGIANFVITDNVSADTITIDASSVLTVQGQTGITATGITIDTTNYNGPTKAIVVSNSFNTQMPTVTIIGDTETYSSTYVEDTLYLVSKNSGNIYLNSTWDESISGTVYNGELLVWGINASNDMAFAVEKLTEDYALFVTGGEFADTYTFGKATINILNSEATIGGFVLGDGSTLTISGITSGIAAIGSIAGVEGSTAGYSIVAESEAAFGTIDGVSALTVAAGQVSATSISYLANGGSLTVDLEGYVQEADKAVVMLTENGINNFLQPVEGQTFSRTTVRATNNDNQIMLYYDETAKAVIGQKPGEIGLVVMDSDERANDSVNGTVIDIDGTTATLVYGYNISGNPEGVAQYIVEGGTIFADATGSYYFFTDNAINANMKNINANGVVVGYDNGDQYHPARYQTDGKTRRGAFTFYAENVRFSWYTRIAAYGYNNGSDDKGFQTLIVSNADDSDATYDITIVGSTNDCDLRIAEYAKISGGTVNVLIDGSTINSGISLFRHTYNNDGSQLKEVNVEIANSTASAARWIYIWDVEQNNSTNLNLTITDTSLTGATDQSVGLFGECVNGTWNGNATVTISGFTTQGRLDGARGDSNNDPSEGITGKRTLFVGGDSFVRVLRNFTNIEVADGTLLSTEEVRLARGAQIILRGERNYSGDVKEYIVASGTVTGINLNGAEFLDDRGYEIDGYGAAIGDKSVFIYKTDGDVYVNMDYTTAITGTTITDRGSVNYLVFDDNAVTSYAAAIDSVDERGGYDYATIQIQNLMARDFYAQGYVLSVNGGQITNLYAGYKPEDEESVEYVDITINSGATVSNVTIANEFSEVDDYAVLTIGDGVSISGTLDGGSDYVYDESNLVFAGSASVNAITGFTNVTLSADGMVSVGTFAGDTITIDAEGFTGFTKKVMVVEGGFEDISDINVEIINGNYGYWFLSDNKTLLITSDQVVDTFVNSDWTEADVQNKFVGDTALIWDENAFASLSQAVAALGDDGVLTIDGGNFTDSVTLTKNNNVIVNAGTTGVSVGIIAADGGSLSVAADFTASALSGFSAIDLAAGKTITVSGGIALEAESAITIDVTGYTQADVDTVVIATDSGITNIDTATITVTGENDSIFYAYYDSADNDVHMMRIDNLYVDVAYGTAGEGIVEGQVNPITGERLIFGVNAFYYLNNALGALKAGQTLYINGRIGNNVNTSDRLASIYLTGSTVPVLINGFTSGDQSYVGDVTMTIENSTIATENGSFLFGTATVNEPWNHPQHIVGNVTVNVIGSTVGGDTGAILVSGMNYVRVSGEDTKITFNFVDSIIRDDFTFIGDSPVGILDEVTNLPGADLAINFENVSVPQDKWWRIMDGNQGSQGTVSVSIKNSTIGGGDGQMRFSLGSWQWGDPANHSRFDFTIENSNIVGYLQSAKHDDGNHAELVNFDGEKTITLIGDNSIRYTYWFDSITLTAGATLTGREIRMASKGGTITVDVTGYTGKSKVIVGMDSAFQNVSAINVIGAEGSEYTVVSSDRSIVIKGAVKDLYVNNTYTAETCPAGTVYNDDLLFFGENAFATDAEAVAALTVDAVVFFTGGDANVLSVAAWSNDISIDASASLTYSGSDVITIAADLVNAGTFTISAAGFVDGTQADVLVLTANSISGAGTFATDDESYMAKVFGNEVHLVLKKSDVYVSTDWAGLPDGSVVSAGVIGVDAFATADAAAAALGPNGSVYVLAGEDVATFSSAIVYNVVAQNGAKVQASVGTTTAEGTLTVQSGAVATGLSVRAKGILTVEAGATVTGGLGMLKGAVVSFAAGSVLDFDISGATAGEAASVTNFSIITGTPDFSITLASRQAEGEYLLATDAANFGSNVTLKVGNVAIGSVGVGSTISVGGYDYTLAITDNNELALTVEEGILPDVPTLAYVNSQWTGLAEGETVYIGDIAATIGYDAFADLGSGIAGVTADGSVVVAGGTVSFADGYYKTITVAADATVVGTASFLNRPITIDGTMAFDVALTTRTTAQFADVQFISGDTKYTLTFDNPAVGTYMLASGLWYDDLYQPVFNGSVTFGDAVLTVGNDVTIGDFTYGLRTTSNLELLLVVDKAVEPTTGATILSACINGTDNMIGRMTDSETTGIASTTQFFWTLADDQGCGIPYGSAYNLADGWVFAGIGDFNGDGMDDMLRYCVEGDAKGFVMADISYGGGIFVEQFLNTKDASWDILGTGDFNGDGTDDILLANRTAASASIGLLGYFASGTTWTLINGYSDEWTLVDTGDYDGNGCTDMLWKNSFVGDGGLTYNAYCTWRLGDLAPETYDWTIVMVTKVNETETPDSDAWSYIGTGDFNNDGIDDIVMQNDMGVIAINTMSDTGTPTNWVIYNQIADTSTTRIAAITDLDNNGCDDIVLAGNEDPTWGTQISYWSTGVDELNRPACDGWTYLGYLA